MKSEALQSKQITELQIISLVTFILLLFSLFGWAYRIYAYHEIKQNISAFESLYTGIAAGSFLRFIVLVFVGILLYKALKNDLRINVFAYFVVVSAFFTTIFIFFDWAALHDIYQGEDDTSNEWKHLTTSAIVNLIFYVTGLITVFAIRSEVSPLLTRKKSVTDEAFFEIIHYVGIVSSLIGLGLIFFACLVLTHNNHDINRTDIIIMNSFCLVILSPYILIILYWLIKLIMGKDPEPFDEKQKHDLTMAGLATWLFSIPIVVAFTLIDNGRMEEISKMIYLQLYVFATLLVFSVSALLNFRKS